MGLQYTLAHRGYGFLQQHKIAWDTWQFTPDVRDHIFFSVARFAKSYSGAYKKVTHAMEFDAHCHELCAWLASELAKHSMTKRLYRALQIIWKWMCEHFVWEFQKQILEGCKDDMDPTRIPEGGWQPNFDFDGLDALMRHPLELVRCNNPTLTGPILATNVLLASSRTRAADPDTLAIRRTPSSTPIYIPVPVSTLKRHGRQHPGHCLTTRTEEPARTC
ncbi:hypothetical protein BDZ91DRAFT_802940 [Kalaharituber pfeilii]|nr:hypothetical protein BDZ91DRAFT_802940 [Kalaharituber pfeilii]